MTSRKNCKKKAKESLRKHYFIFVLACLIAAIIGTGYSSSYNALSESVQKLTFSESEVEQNAEQKERAKLQINQIVRDILDKQVKDTSDVEKELLDQEKQGNPMYVGKHLQIGYNRGVLANVRNEVVSGVFVISLLTALASSLGSSTAAAAILVILSFLLIFLIWTFGINVYKVIYARIFLEGRTYKKVPMQRFAFLIYVRKWGKAAMTMLLKAIYFNLWSLTVVGGIIKYFSYFAVPYIVAENPDISPKEAIRLSREMMNGHKWECFKFRLSFIGWSILDSFTFGVSGILFSNPYMEASLCEYYANIRQEAKEKQIAGIEKLNDTYLYEIPSQEQLLELYGDEANYEVTVQEEKKSFVRRIGDFFGFYISEKEYESEKEFIKQKARYQRVKNILHQEEYSYKLFSIPEKKRSSMVEFLHFDRKYSIWTLFLFFIFFSFIGWIWEVSLHLVQGGGFVNRGTLQGPCPPIYGTGAMVILLFLNKLRKNPVLELAGAILLCGFVEYMSGFMLEKMHDGQKWWNYTGYYLNLDGRVCAEGLLVFGIGGMIIVYLIAPLFDNLVRRIPRKIVLIISLILLIVFGVDTAYSSVHPNTGEGITSSIENQELTQILDKSC